VQKQKLVFLIVGIVAGLIAVWMLKSYIKEMDENTRKQAQKALEKMRQNQAAILVARQDIPANTIIQPSMFEAAVVPREYVQPQAATSLDNVSGMTTIAPISRGEQISLTKLSSAGQVTKKRDLSSVTPPGKRAVAVVAENITDVVGLVKPGDSVDLIAVLSVTKDGPAGKKMTAEQTIVPAFQNVTVLAVGQDVDPSSSQSKSSSREKVTQITVALNPTEANILAFLQDQGKIRIVLRSGQDTQIEEVKPVTWQSVLEQIPALKPEEQEKITIYRGLKKEEIVLSK